MASWKLALLALSSKPSYFCGGRKFQTEISGLLEHCKSYNYSFMFGLGGSELVVIALCALLVFGPSKIPEIARTVKRGFLEWNKVKGQVDDTISDLKREIDLKAKFEDELAPIFSPAKKISPRKEISAKSEGLLPDDQVQPPHVLEIPEHDDYLTPDTDELYPPKVPAAAVDDDYLGDE